MLILFGLTVSGKENMKTVIGFCDDIRYLTFSGNQINNSRFILRGAEIFLKTLSCKIHVKKRNLFSALGD